MLAPAVAARVRRRAGRCRGADRRLAPARGPVSGGSRTTATIAPAALGRRRSAEGRSPPKRRHAARRPGRATGRRRRSPGRRLCPVDRRARRSAGHEHRRRAPGRRQQSLACRKADGRRRTCGTVAANGDASSDAAAVGRGATGAVHVSEVEVDTRLGKVRVLRVAGALAVGRIAAPELARTRRRRRDPGHRLRALRATPARRS